MHACLPFCFFFTTTISFVLLFSWGAVFFVFIFIFVGFIEVIWCARSFRPFLMSLAGLSFVRFVFENKLKQSCSVQFYDGFSCTFKPFSIWIFVRESVFFCGQILLTLYCELSSYISLVFDDLYYFANQRQFHVYRVNISSPSLSCKCGHGMCHVIGCWEVSLVIPGLNVLE